MKKTKIGIIAGEDIDMPEQYLKEHDIKIYNYNILWDKLGNERTSLYKSMRKYKGSSEFGTPHTSQPSVGIFRDLYQSVLKNHDTVFVVAISSKLSGSYNSAMKAVELLDKPDRSKVTVFDSYTISSGTAFIIRELIDLINQAVPFSELKIRLIKMHTDINVIAMIEDTFWLQKGGRLSPVIGMIIDQMKKINIRPLLGVKDGKISLLKVRTHAKNKVDALWSFLDIELADKKAEVIITHADDLKEAEELRALFKKKPNCEVLYINLLSPVLGAHVGPDSLIVGWRVKDN